MGSLSIYPQENAILIQIWHGCENQTVTKRVNVTYFSIRQRTITEETGLPFQNSGHFQKFSIGTSQEVVFYLHANRNFRYFLEMVDNVDLRNTPFPSYFEPHYEREVNCKAFYMKISFVCRSMKTNFRNKTMHKPLLSQCSSRQTWKWSFPAPPYIFVMK